MRQTRFAEVHMRVYNTRKDVTSGCIYYTIKGISTLSTDSFGYYLFYSVILNDDVSLLLHTLIDDSSTFY